MNIINRLPTELLLHVLSYFDSSADRQTLISLCSTSRKFLDLGRPVLYEDVSDIGLPDDLLMRTIARSNNGRMLGRMIRHAKVSAVRDDGAEVDGEYSLDAEDRLLSVERHWCASMAFLALCPYLDHFSFEIESQTNSPDPLTPEESGSVIPSAKDLLLLPFLRSLRRLSLLNNSGIGCKFGPFGRLIVNSPSLQGLSLHRIDPSDLLAPVFHALQFQTAPDFSLSALTWDEVELNGDPSPCYIEEFLATLTKLPTLQTLTIHSHYINTARLEEFNAVHAIQLKSITRLELYLDDASEMEFYPDWLPCLLRHFPHLQHLTTDLAFNNLLPTQATHLHLTHATLRYPSPLHKLCQGESRLPLLQSKWATLPTGLTDLTISFDGSNSTDFEAKYFEGWLGATKPYVEHDQIEPVGVRRFRISYGMYWLTFVRRGVWLTLESGNATERY